jgi:hypothetical protein
LTKEMRAGILMRTGLLLAILAFVLCVDTRFSGYTVKVSFVDGTFLPELHKFCQEILL